MQVAFTEVLGSSYYSQFSKEGLPNRDWLQHCYSSHSYTGAVQKYTVLDRTVQNCTVLYKFMARAKDLGRGKTTQAFYRFAVYTSRIDSTILDRDELRYTEFTEVLGSPYYSQA